MLELVAKRSRALIDARATGLTLIDGDELVVAAAAGEGVEGLRGTRLASTESFAGRRAADGRAASLPRAARGRASPPASSRAHGARGADDVPQPPDRVPHAFDRLEGDAAFTEEDERLLQAFAASAATAVATAQSASEEAVRRSLSASEQERRRWARELHDETLQELAGLKVLISGARRSDDPSRRAARGLSASRSSRAAIAEPPRADHRAAAGGARRARRRPALEALVDAHAGADGVEIELEVELAYEHGRGAARHAPELELAIYRLVQEALNNVVKHAEAERVSVTRRRGGDDGRRARGPRRRPRVRHPRGERGLRLLGMRERVEAVHGSLAVDSTPGGGTKLVARLPIARRGPAAAGVSWTSEPVRHARQRSLVRLVVRLSYGLGHRRRDRLADRHALR